MTVFDQLEAMANGTLDTINAERFEIVPMAAKSETPNGRSGRDEDREITRGKGVFEYISAEAGLQLGVRKSYRESNDLRALQVGRVPSISIDRRVYFPEIEMVPRQGDVIQLVERQYAPTFEITSAQPDGHGRIVLKLVARGPQADLQGDY